jgi:hypothetical protein
MPADQEPKLPHRFFPSLTVLIFLFLISLAGPAPAQDVADKFPDPARVTADYPDEAQRYAAFETLDTVLTRLAPKPVSRAAYNKLFSYEANYNNIESLHLQAGAQSQAYKDWVAKRDAAIGDFALARAVVDKYQLTGLKAAPLPSPKAQPVPNVSPPASVPNSAPNPNQAPSPNPPPSYDPKLFTAPRRQFVSEHTAFFFLLPVAFVSWFLMYWAARFLLGRAGETSLSGNPPQPEVDRDWPSLPETLRTVHLPGVKYYVRAYTGLVLDKSTQVTTSTFTSSTPDQVNVIGNTVQVTPGVTTTTRTRSQADTLRIRTPELRESTWTFTGSSGNQIFPGQILTALTRPTKDGFSEFVLAYNHATGELIRVEEGLAAAHASTGLLGWLAQPVATLIGTIGFSIVIAYLLTSPPPIITFGFDMSGVILLMAGGFCSLTTAFFMTNLLRARVRDRRSKNLIDEYGAPFRQYCQQIRPAVEKRFGIKTC